MTTTVTASDAARNLPDLLERVHDRGETFVIVRGDERMARLTAVTDRPAAPTLAKAVALLVANRSGDPAFADDLEEIQAEQGLLPAAARSGHTTS